MNNKKPNYKYLFIIYVILYIMWNSLRELVFIIIKQFKRSKTVYTPKEIPLFLKIITIILIISGCLLLQDSNLYGFFFLCLGLHFLTYWLNFYSHMPFDQFILLIVMFLEYIWKKLKK